MGLLQSCQNGGDTRLSVSLDSSMFRQRGISTNFNATDFYFQQSKVNLFGDIFYKKAGDRTQFILQTHFTNRTSQVISHTMKIYTDSASFMHEKGSKIKIVHSIDDPNYLGKQIFIIKLLNKPHQTYLKLVPFNRYEDQKFKRALYQIAMLHSALQEQNNKYGFVYQDAFVVESGIDKDQNDKCLVIVGDSVNASLNQIIMFKKMAQVPWSQKQFQALCYQLIKGTLQLHKHRISHRDIRPHNVFYSPLKKGYVLGGYNNSVALGKTTNNAGFNLAGVPYYMPSYLYEVGKRQDFSEYYNYNPYEYDTYSLGLTLLNALFLDQFMPPEVLKSSIEKYATKYRFLKTIGNMISQNPPSLSQALTELGSVSNQIEQKNSIEALRYKLKPQDEQFVNKKKNIAEGYYQMFMYDEWVEQINEVVNYYELNQDNMQLADIYRQIADIYSEHYQQEMMIQYYSRASTIYLQISGDCIEEKKNEEAIQYLQKGIDCNRKGYRGQANTDLAYLLNKLAMAHHVKGQYEVARAFQEQSLDIIAKVNGQNSAQYAEMLADSAKIQMQFQQFKQAENMLKAGLKIIDRKDQTKQNQVVKAKLLQSLGSTFRMKAIERRDKCEVYRKKAEDCLLDALDITQKIEGSIHPQVGSILLNLGNVYFDRKQFDKAKKSYEKALIVKQHTNKGKQTVEIGECLTYLANSEKLLKEYDKSIKHYDEAIQVFRKAYGNDHNENTAVAIGNLGLVYKELNRRHEQRQYLTLAKSILKDLFGEQCPDYQYFDRQMTR